MKEASKTNKLRSPDFANIFLKGTVLDIGSGGDMVCDWARSFDMEDGDANNITEYVDEESFDTVHSSHCLEHMIDPCNALKGWWSVVKKGGYLILVVPEENLYEQGIFPSVFNNDHKSTFRLGGDSSWSKSSYDILDLCKKLPDSEIISAEIQDHLYDKRYIFPSNLKPLRKIPKINKLILSFFKRLPIFGMPLNIWYRKHLVSKGVPFDQTQFDALAQIQIILRKKLVVS